MLEIKILAYKSPQRYAVRRTLYAAQRELKKSFPGLELVVTEITSIPEMRQYTEVLILPSLIVNARLVCVGRFPKKAEVIGWLREAVRGQERST